MTKVIFKEQRLRRPAVVAMGFGYGEPLQVWRADIDDIVGCDWPDIPNFQHWAGVIGHIADANHGS